jgi:hypothetical protein
MTWAMETVASELARCKSDFVGVQEVRWDNGGSEPADNYAFFYIQIGMLIII